MLPPFGLWSGRQGRDERYGNLRVSQGDTTDRPDTLGRIRSPWRSSRRYNHPMPSLKAIGGLLLAILGLCVAAYGGIGSLFVMGAVQRGDPSVSWGDVIFLWVVGLIGIAAIAVGVVLLVLTANHSATRKTAGGNFPTH